MLRIGLFLLVVGGGAYLVVDRWIAPAIGPDAGPVVKVSLAVIIAVLMWTVLIWIVGERLGVRDGATKGDPSGPAG